MSRRPAADEPGSVGAALRDATRELERSRVPEARRNAEILLAHLLDTDRGGLLVRRGDPLAPALARRYADWILRRGRREPLQHLIGEEEFHGLRFEVDARVLIPRPETEGLVDELLRLPLPPRARVADLGTGSGCLCVTMAVKRPRWSLFAIDASRAALEVARRNASRHGVAERVELRVAGFAAPPVEWRATMDAVVANPPYVTEREWAGLEPEVRDHDPREALVSGATGLEGYREVAPAAAVLLRRPGFVALELGAGQAEAVGGIVRQAGFGAVRVVEDLRGIPRVLIARAE